MKKACFVLAAILLVVAAGCSSSPPNTAPSSPAPASPARTSPAVSAPISAPGSVIPTAGQLATAGQTIFANRCRCHGDRGQGVTGPAIIGGQAHLDKYNTAKGLLDFISTAMPMNAPGTLSQPEYLQVWSYLLVQNGYVSADTAMDPGKPSQISLAK